MGSLYDYQGNEIGVTPQMIEPQGNDIPIVTITGELPTTKTQGEINVVLTYHSLSDEFTSYATVKVQGDSSTEYPKKNFTIKLFSNSLRSVKLKKKFRDWDKERNKFVLKANWIDHSHSRNIVNARIWSQIVKSRSDYDSLPSALTGGNLAVDGFPVKVFNNGTYMGLYTWNLPKDALYGLDDSVDSNAIVQGDGGGYSGSILWRASSNSDNKWTDETHDTMPTVIANGFNTLLDFVYTSTDANFVTNFASHFDKQSIIDQYIFLIVGCIVDNIGKNQTFFTYDAQKWYGGMYDMDGTWGLPPYRVSTVGWKSSSTVFQDGYTAVAEGTGATNLLYERLGNLFSSDIQTRYTALRDGVLSADNINAMFEEFIQTIPLSLYAEDYASTTGGGNFINIPLVDSNNVQQIRQFVIDRLVYADSLILT